MSNKECASLMIWCGAIKDIEEKTYDEVAKKQLKDIRSKIENLVFFSAAYSQLIYEDETYNI